MPKLTLNPQLKAALNDLNDEIELYDENGRVVGRVLPEEHYQRLIDDAVNAQVSDEELERNRQGSRTYSTSEVLEYLKEL